MNSDTTDTMASTDTVNSLSVELDKNASALLSICEEISAETDKEWLLVLRREKAVLIEEKCLLRKLKNQLIEKNLLCEQTAGLLSWLMFCFSNAFLFLKEAVFSYYLCCFYFVLSVRKKNISGVAACSRKLCNLDCSRSKGLRRQITFAWYFFSSFGRRRY